MAHAKISPPSPFVQQWLHNLTGIGDAAGSVIDLACGSGRHGRLFLVAGSRVTFLDRDVSAVADLSDDSAATVVEADLEGGGAWPLAGRQYDVVIVTNYLWRPNWSRVLDLVKPGGYLLYETFAEGNEAYGRPSNPKFLLKSGELLQVTSGRFEVLEYHHGLQTEPAEAVKQMIAARRFV